MAKLSPAPIASLAVVMLLASCQDNGPILLIGITPSVATVASGDTLRFHATVRHLAGKEIAAPDVKWTTNDDAIAIDATGLATGRFTGAERTVVVTATTDNVSASVPVLLKPCVRCGNWTQRSGLSVPRSSAAVVVVDGMVYTVGGAFGGGLSGTSVATVEMFDPATGSWSRRASLPDSRQGAQGVTVDGRLYVFGGEIVAPSGGSDIARSYEPASNSWTVLPPMPRVRIGTGSFRSLAVFGGRVYAINPGLGIVDIYDPATNTWTLGATPTSPVPSIGGPFVLDGRIYYFDGDRGTMYDPSTDQWISRAPLPSGRSEATKMALHGKLYAIGGFGRPVSCGEFLCQGPRSNLVEIFDPVTNAWTAGSAMPITNQIIFADTVGGKLLVSVFGETIVQSTSLIYDGERDAWAIRARLPYESVGVPSLSAGVSVGGSFMAIFVDRRAGTSAVMQFTP